MGRNDRWVDGFLDLELISDCAENYLVNVEVNQIVAKMLKVIGDYLRVTDETCEEDFFDFLGRRQFHSNRPSITVFLAVVTRSYDTTSVLSISFSGVWILKNLS